MLDENDERDITDFLLLLVVEGTPFDLSSMKISLTSLLESSLKEGSHIEKGFVSHSISLRLIFLLRSNFKKLKKSSWSSSSSLLSMFSTMLSSPMLFSCFNAMLFALFDLLLLVTSLLILREIEEDVFCVLYLFF